VVSLEIFDLITFRFSQNQTHFGLHVQRVSDGRPVVWIAGSYISNSRFIYECNGVGWTPWTSANPSKP
jgi:hypothetical protein